MIEKSPTIITYLYNHRFMRYLFVGGSTFVIDLGLLIFLREKVHLRLVAATTFSYWTSITYNFCLNRWWTFSASENTSLKKHLVSYAVLLGFNYIFTVFFVSTFSQFINYSLAKIISVAIQMTWTYYIYKKYIFIRTTTKVNAL
jgi:putative flippase GtrA